MSELHTLFNKIDKCEFNYFKSLTEEERKKFYLFLVQRWMSGTTDSKQIQYLNSFVNNKIFALYYDPDLVYKLLCTASTGPKRYEWKGRKKKEKSTEILDVVQTYYKCDLRDAKEYVKILSKEDIFEMADAIGYDKEAISKLKKEFK